MKRIVIICSVICLLFTLSAAAGAANDLSFAPVFGKVTYEDCDGNGFSDATWVGFRLQDEWRFANGMIAQFRYDYGSNDDAVGQDPEWRNLVAKATTDGKVSRQSYLISILYPVGKFRLGLGYLLNQFKETEYGFVEHRDYQGLCLTAERALTKDGLTKVAVRYAPALSVDDDVKGDWDNPDRTAAVSYDGSFWELNLARVFVNRERFTLTGGLDYSELSGDGADHAEYRFLDHDLKLKEFYIKAEWKF